MGAIAEQFSRLKDKNQKALIPFVTGGDPSLKDLPEILSILEAGGADLIEVGLPFSDPIADGPVIQASSYRALQRGVTAEAVLEALEKTNLSIPIVLMGYTNPILKFGYEEFVTQARRAGVSGVILCDLIPEEAQSWLTAAQNNNLDTIFLAAPTSTQERLSKITQASSGFVYALSRAGVTGVAEQSQTREAQTLVSSLRDKTNLPICVGFGIKTPEQVREVHTFADGAIVGSAIVEWLHRNWQNGKGKTEFQRFISFLKPAS